MIHTLSDQLWEVLICSQCGGELTRLSTAAQCRKCRTEYPFTESGVLDLRLTTSKKYPLSIDLGTPLNQNSSLEYKPLVMNPNPAVDFSPYRVPWHLSKEIMSYFPKAQKPGNLMLDLGCGNGVHRDVCEYAGFEWVGLDYDSSGAPILGDAHALPFKENTFEFILSVAVLEHIRFPLVMMQEVQRVLKPNGIFIGTVAFLEPFHGDSYYHHTHLGTLNSLQSGGLKVIKLAPDSKWTVLAAQAQMGLFPQMPQPLAKSIIFPMQLLHQLWWKMGNVMGRKADEFTRITHTTGSFTFIASK